MAFGYAFVDLDTDQKNRRRELLDHYALVAQISFLAILVLIRVYYLLSWLGRQCSSADEEATPSSPYVKHERIVSSSTWATKIRKSWDQWSWWCGEPLINGWGTKGGWLLGGVWLLWLLLLSFLQTAPGKSNLPHAERTRLLTVCRLPTSHETFRNHWSISTSISLLTRHEVAVCTNSDDYAHVPRRN